MHMDIGKDGTFQIVCILSMANMSDYAVLQTQGVCIITIKILL